jgi:hypothetical protein
MSLYGLSVFALVYTLAVAAPGPGVAAIVARALSRDSYGTPAFIAGFLVGDLIWFTFAATGLAMLAQAAYAVFVVVKFAVLRICCISPIACGPRRRHRLAMRSSRRSASGRYGSFWGPWR